MSNYDCAPDNKITSANRGDFIGAGEETLELPAPGGAGFWFSTIFIFEEVES